MAEFGNAAVQTVAAGQNVLFGEENGCSARCIMHREGSGIITLKGLTDQCRARFHVFFSGNIAVATGGTAGEISLAISLQGEPLQTAVMTATPAAVGDFWNVSKGTYIDVPRGCCLTVSVENVSAQAVDVRNANLIVVRVA